MILFQDSAPKLGIQEDRVTGSAHCQLIPYWSKVLNKKYACASYHKEESFIVRI